LRCGIEALLHNRRFYVGQTGRPKTVFRLAHLSDVHLGPLPPGAAWRDFQLKRPIGYASWTLRRRRLHDPAVAALLATDIAAQAPDHVALTGDMVNIAAHAEFPAAARWIARLGDGRALSFVPGNHDCYVPCPWEAGLAHFAPWMAGEMRVKDTVTSAHNAAPFPFVRLRRNIALIGLTTGLPQALHRAGGKLGQEQIDSLAQILRDLRERGFARIVLIHHPPLPGLAVKRKALVDAAALQGVLETEGAELVLHGHNHRQMLNRLPTRWGTCHVLGTASASSNGSDGHEPAAWNLYSVVRQDGRWTVSAETRSYQPASGTFELTAELALST
jgi:3',5'-cyclic AMP phosphodiesterase CpdA